MKKTITRLVCCLLLALLLVGTLSVSAAEQQPPEWTFGEDADTLTDGERVYTYYYLPFNVVCTAQKVYLLTEECYDLVDPDLYLGYLYSIDEGGGDIIWTGNRTDRYLNGVYVNQAGKENLDRLMGGQSTIYRLKDSERAHYAPLDRRMVKKLGQLNTAKLMDVRSLAELERYEIYAFDDTDTWGVACGAVYVMNDTYYYLDYSKLSNGYFDSEGNFSYRSGEVWVKYMTEDQAEVIDETADALTTIPYEYFPLGEEIEEEPEEARLPLAVFWIVYLFLGVLSPIPLIFVGILMATSRKMGYPKYWYVLSVIAGMWMLLAIVLAVLLVLI